MSMPDSYMRTLIGKSQNESSMFTDNVNNRRLSKQGPLFGDVPEPALAVCNGSYARHDVWHLDVQAGRLSKTKPNANENVVPGKNHAF